MGMLGSRGFRPGFLAVLPVSRLGLARDAVRKLTHLADLDQQEVHFDCNKSSYLVDRADVQ